MNFLKLKEIVCRICLHKEASISWYDKILELSGKSYKDCYYKYTSLEEMDPDTYPSNLCNKCAEDLINVHKLIEKALESANILKELEAKHYINMDKCNNSLSPATSEIVADNMDKELVEEKACLTLCKIETSSKFENISNESEKVKNIDGTTVEPTHFVDIRKFELPTETPVEANFDKFHVGQEAVTYPAKRTYKKRKCRDRKLQDTFDHQINETADTLSSPPIKRLRREKAIDIPQETLNKKITEVSENSDNKPMEMQLKESSLEIFKTSKESAEKSKKEYKLMCSYCSLKVKGAKNLELHEATHNENRERTVTCPKCGLKLYTAMALHFHMKIHDSNRQKNHKCDFCEKAFFNKGGLNIHRRIHLGQMIKCQMCEKEFFRRVDLDKHLLKHAASPLEKNVGKKKLTAQCQYCNKYILTAKLKEHIAVHLNQPLVKCKICEKNFYSRTKCTSHLRRFHLKNLSEYEEFIHYYVDRNRRLSSLMIKQQLVAQAFDN